MSEKLSWVELRKNVAARANVSEKTAGQWLDAWIGAIAEGLKEDGTVKLNGLGTLQAKRTAPRKSVNVNTGEDVTLDGYYKVSITAEPSVRDAINRGAVNPNVQREIQSIIDPIAKLGEQADEILEILGDINSLEQEAGTEPEAAEATVATEAAEETTAVVEDTKDDNQEVKQEAGIQRPWLVAGITVLIFTLILAGAFLTLGWWFTGWTESLHERLYPTEVVEPEAGLEPIEAENIADTQVETRDDAQEGKQETAMRDYSKVITTEEMHQDSRLAWMAYRYYGEKDLWVFIYEANKENIPNPHAIKVGTPIRIPDLAPEWRDVNNPATRAAIDSLKRVYE